ncbi:aldo/keto reductase [Sphaerospermopsis aphanizomenoides]|uniref:aldo/keto reductase n=1 Tax=Sphaerospermopsis aphanizomenoides TaxID=459663 RepID=UPI001D156AF4|nr:aldo/keto reductase [Sphaerospermopsis aphanizomenoides]
MPIIGRIALGTAQFGLSYGVANRQGQVTVEEGSKIVSYAASVGVDTLDTAIAYGSSEECLGQIGVKDWRVISKLPEIPSGTTNIQNWVQECVDGSLGRLKISQLYALLLHRPQQLLQPQGRELYDTLNLLKTEGLVNKIGISIYSPKELPALFGQFSFDLIQAPFNILDRSLEESGWLSHLHNMGVEVHVRSIFLQGLLLMESDTRPSYFQRWYPLWMEWQNWLLNSGLNPLQACLGFVLSHPSIDRVVVGVDSFKQLQEILAATTAELSVNPPDKLCCNDPDLINPALWRLR